MELSIQTAERGFYTGFSKDVAIASKILIAALIVWAIAGPETAAWILGDLNGALLGTFASWYIYVVAPFLIVASFWRWGFSAWACYAIVGLSLAYFSYRRNLPLTIRSALTPLFGESFSDSGQRTDPEFTMRRLADLQIAKQNT